MSALPLAVQGGAMLILDLEDQFAQQRGLSGPHPRPLGTFRFSLLATTDPGSGLPARLASPLEMCMLPNASGFYLFFGRVKHRDGSVRNVDASGWPWTIRVESACYQTLEIALPAAADTFASSTTGGALRHIALPLAPSAAYPFPEEPMGYAGGRVRGVVRKTDGAPMAGVRVEVLDGEGKPQPIPAVSGADGQWVAILTAMPANGVVTVRFTQPGGLVQEAREVPVLRSRENNVTQTVLRGQVRRKGKPAPGATVRISLLPAAQVITNTQGYWMACLDVSEAGVQATVTAQLAEGRASKKATVKFKARATVDVPGFDF